jgi:hypothetical protein
MASHAQKRRAASAVYVAASADVQVKTAFFIEIRRRWYHVPVRNRARCRDLRHSRPRHAIALAAISRHSDVAHSRTRAHAVEPVRAKLFVFIRAPRRA